MDKTNAMQDSQSGAKWSHFSRWRITYSWFLLRENAAHRGGFFMPFSGSKGGAFCKEARHSPEGTMLYLAISFPLDFAGVNYGTGYTV